MNKNDIIKTIKKYNLDFDKCVILSGAALVLMGIKEKTIDIDLSVTKDYYDYLVNNYDCKIDCIDANGYNVYYIDDIINFGLNYWPDNIQVIDGIKVQSLEEIIKLKKLLNRKKDKKDLDLIYKYKE